MQSPTPPPRLNGQVNLTKIEQAIGRAVAYADLFDYPLTAAEIHRYLELEASLAAVETALSLPQLHNLIQIDDYFLLAEREAIVEKRLNREARAQRLWPQAIHYGRLMAKLPFVRMVAVTGSLAVNNPDSTADIDYLIVTESGRLWLARAAVIVIVRLAARRGLNLCPNYFITQNNLHFSQQNLYTAHEIAQMVPLTGLEIYTQLRQANLWVQNFLPNTNSEPQITNHQPLASIQPLLELPLRTPLGRWLERWEMGRKIRKFQAQHSDLSETQFTADCCKGHFDQHQSRTQHAFEKRVRRLE